MAKKKMTLEEKMEEAIVMDVPYEVPRNWKFIKFNYILSKDKNSLKRGPFGSAIKKDYFVQSGYKVYEQKNAIYDDMNLGNYYIDENKYRELEAFSVKSGDLIVSCSGTVGKIALIPKGSKEGIINQALLKISLNEEIILKKYFIFLFNSEPFISKIIDNSRGSAIKNIAGTKILKEVAVPIPPLKEQQRIIERIESLFEKLDNAKELIEEARVGFEKRKSAILEKAFRGELTENWRVKKRVIKEYKTYILKDLLKPMTTIKPNVSEEYFRYIDIDSIDNKNQIVGEPKIVETAKAPSRASKEVIKGDILFSTVRPYLKNIAYITEDLEDCIASTGFYICRCKEILDSRFLYMMLCSDKVLNYYTSLMKGDNSPSIRKGEFEGLKINLPSVEEQKEIVRILDKLLEDESKIEELTALEDQIELIKKSTLAKAFRGELGTNDSNEESALELLKEILSKE
ncbi:restriction endonuclease subunit S [Clostridium botulinum]|uniref:restriction endonuclease subunit S n=1 Tax=Clostridium botulinum TaxID=1491 RepID=UPI0013F92F34|nr:restriction endonuclease subunit S [Clostridium botulinum]MBN1077892.1 restriction endonuclease subunit S [Clostridium botulinum]NFF82771.1 restriction endonuclease subunit S [Clostridium botulinum]